MNKKYKVAVHVENEKYVYLSITHNGNQWSSLSIKDPEVEIPLIISALQRHLTLAEAGQETPVCNCIEWKGITAGWCPVHGTLNSCR